MAKKMICLLLAASLIFLIGCFGRTAQGSLAVYGMTFDLADASDIEVHDFRLGTIDLIASNGAVVQGPLAGIIALPDAQQPRPLVVILHGATMMAHENINARVYSGFDYLVAQLAAEGYVAMSINVNANYAFALGESRYPNGWAFDTFDAHIAALALANTGEDAGHGIDLTGRIDLEEIHLIGHSRGGDVAARLAQREQEADRDRIASIIHLATAAGTFHLPPDHHDFDPDADPADFAQPNVPTAFILPEYDGDINSLDGQGLFDEIVADAQHQHLAHVVFLRGAGHNFFNRVTIVDDRASELSHANENDQSTWLSREAHERFLLHYAAAFLAVVTGQREPWGTFNASEPQPATLFGFAATASTYFPGTQPLMGTTVPIREHGTAQVNHFVQSFPAQAVGHGLFNHPGVLSSRERRLPLRNITWDSRNSAVAFELVLDDITQAAAISLFVGVDSSDARNTMGEHQSLSVGLTDTHGAAQFVTIPVGTSALFTHRGEVLAVQGFGDIWLGHTPLGELRVPLQHFDEIDLRAVAQLTLRFDQTGTGAVMLGGVYLV
ncbi:MAG: hypothetical protein FWB76_07230 [Oscillospiraceae bacterium]|nr:hypothetical protein [Oscillospiraceae bacterium]